MKSFSSQDKNLEKGLSSKYFQTLFEGLDATSRSSAQVIVPLVLELLQPRSVIDIGCGVGSWLAVFKECGVQDILGVDFDCVDRKLLQIPKEQFFPFDLKKPLKIERQFDLVLCLEVAGYIPDESAAIFVNSLTELGSAILFSAAVPLQDDPAIQVNQQWPEYWFSFFQQKGYIVIDCLRKKIWNNPDVAWWFAQNLLLFVRQDYLESQEQLQKEFENTCTAQLSIIHPQLYINMSQKAPGMKVILSALPVSALNAVKRRLGR